MAQIETSRTEIESIEYWRQISPNSKITSGAFSNLGDPISFSGSDIERYKYSLRSEGYFKTPSCIDQMQLECLCQIVIDVMSKGHPPVYALLYDAFYETLLSLSNLLSGLLGQGYKMIPDEPDVYFIPTSKEQGGTPPHRDSLRSLDMYTDDGLPELINIWVALTDVTADNSCMHVVPAQHDPNYRSNRSFDDTDPTSGVNLQSVRALPVKAGSVIGWSTELLHWGGFSSDDAVNPRLSFAMYFQRGDCRDFHKNIVFPNSPLPFEHRLYIVEKLFRDPMGKNIPKQYLTT